MGTHRIDTGGAWPPPPSFWADLPGLTEGCTMPALFKTLMPPGTVELPDVLGAVANIREAHADGTPCASRVRVYVDEDRRDDLAAEVLRANPWSDADGFVPWVQTLVDAERFSLIVNNLEVASESVAAALAPFVAGAFAGWGVPVGGVEQVAFAGNYSSTAFGVHEGFEDAFLVHLGPGTKLFYCWTQQQYVELTGSAAPTFGDFRWLLDHGELFVMEPGDILFLPRRVFHVGVQDEFSTSIAIPLYTYPDARYLGLGVVPEVTQMLLGQAGAALDEPSAMHALGAGPNGVAKHLIPAARAALAHVEEHLEDMVGQVLDHKWQALLSNGGWEVVADDLARSRAVQETEGRSLQPGDVVRVRPPYAVRRAASDVVYLRGTAVPLPDGAAEVVAALEAGGSVTVDASSVETLGSLAITGGLEIVGSSAVRPVGGR